jgi:hypothetical protein
MAQALTGQLGVANNTAKRVQNTMQSNVLGTARGQVSDAQTGMSQVSRLATSDALERATANQQVAQSKVAALAQLGSTFVAQGMDNMGTTGKDAAGNTARGSFLTPVNRQGAPVQGFGNRLSYSEFFGRG